MFIQVKGSTTWSLVIRAEMFRFQSAILSDDGDDNDYGKQASNGWLRIKKRKKNKKNKKKGNKYFLVGGKSFYQNEFR